MTRQKLRNNCYYTEIIKHTMLLHIHQVHKFSRSFEKRTTWKRLIRFVMLHNLCKLQNVNFIMSFTLKTGLAIKTLSWAAWTNQFLESKLLKMSFLKKDTNLTNLDKMTQRKMPIYLQMKSCLKNASNFKCCYRHT